MCVLFAALFSDGALSLKLLANPKQSAQQGPPRLGLFGGRSKSCDSEKGTLQRRDKELLFKSKSVTASEKGLWLELDQDVILQKGATKLLADWVKVSFVTASRDFKSMTAKGHVVVENFIDCRGDSWSLSSDEARYDQLKEEAFFEGNVVIRQGERVVYCHKATYSLVKGQLITEKVRGVISGEQ
tara:strand:+ start:276 stop:830 length:555 start_codon:yes stop_codon:yes gene_type:complete